MRKIQLITIIIVWIGAVGALAQSPSIISYQGRLTAGGTNLYSGLGQFQFALVNSGSNSTTYWSNDGNSTGGGEPEVAVTVPVTQGLFSVHLGDTTISNMTMGIPPSIFTNSDVWLRIWFSDGVSGFQQLCPDQQFTAVGYAMMSANVPDGTITSAKLAPGAVSIPNMQVFANSGSFTVPSGINRIMVEVWGGGGGGGGSTVYSTGGGGGGGGFGKDVFIVVPGTIFNVSVGNGGTGGNAGQYGQAGAAGWASSFGSLISAQGGSGGGGGNFNHSGGVGGAGGTSSATFNSNGSQGSGGAVGNSSSYTAGGSGGAAGGGGGGGGGGGNGNENNGSPGSILGGNGGNGAAPGGGGGAGGQGATWSGNGGNGAAGLVVVYW